MSPGYLKAVGLFEELQKSVERMQVLSGELAAATRQIPSGEMAQFQKMAGEYLSALKIC